jgi:hypothetical protein
MGKRLGGDKVNCEFGQLECLQLNVTILGPIERITRRQLRVTGVLEMKVI